LQIDTDVLLIITSTRGTNIDDLEPRQPAYEIFTIKRRF